MEKWLTSSICLIQQEYGETVQMVELDCQEVWWSPAPDIEDATHERGEAGYLLVKGADTMAVRALEWAPTLVQFNIEKFTEPRQFETAGMEVNDGTFELKLYLP